MRRFSSGFLLLSLFFLLTYCSDKKSEKSLFEGKWKANWSTSKEAFPEVGNEVALKMEGWVEFDNDEITITAFGYPGCIFSADTITHSQKWVLRSDTLELLNEGDRRGISYLLKEKSDSRIRLVLMGDIFLDLTR